MDHAGHGDEFVTGRNCDGNDLFGVLRRIGLVAGQG